MTIVFPVQFLDSTQAGFFEPQGIIAIGTMGLIGVWLSMHTGFPDAWDAVVLSRLKGWEANFATQPFTHC